MKLLLTSAGITNPSIHAALVELMGKPVAESSALIVAAGMYPFPNGALGAWRAISGNAASPFAELGWNSLGVLELTALPSIQEESWIPTLRETDALYVFGGNVLYLSYWMKRSGLVALLPTLTHLVYVGCSAGSIVMTPFNCDAEFNAQFVPAGSEMAHEGDRALGLVDFALRVHVDNPDPMFEDSSTANVEEWATGIPASTYAIDDQSAVVVRDEVVEVVSEGRWSVFPPVRR